MRRISRRTMLKGAGVAIGLPMLEAMLPAPAFAASASSWPTRAAFFFTPNGVHMPNWRPAQAGGAFELPATLQAFERFREKMTILSGMALDAGRPHGDGPGDHARAAATFLTGVHPVKTAGAGIHVGTSVDQLIAGHVGNQTRFPSLELGLEQGLNAGGCDSGYSCAYSSNVSWRTPTTPATKETHPKLVFERLFGGDKPGETSEARAQRARYQKSILDFVRDEAASLGKKVGGADRQKLDEYLTGVREVELRVEHFTTAQKGRRPSIDLPEEKPKDFVQHYRLMGDLLVLALQTDLTRVVSFMVGNAGSNRPYKEIDVAEGHHSLSHHGNDANKLAQISKINRFHADQLSYILAKMEAIREGDATLLDHSLLLYGSGISDGNRHNHDDLPIALFGRASGAFKQGQHIVYDKETPLCNLYLTMARTMGLNLDTFGDSQGLVESILA